jgi:ubiquinone/menaquinone biosynthesis C-methylase UbiE
MTPCPPSIAAKIDAFIDACRPLAATMPAVVVMAMHEYARNLYPSDPYIPFPEGVHRLDAIDALLDRLTAFVRAGAVLGSYGAPSVDGTREDVRDQTGMVYGKLWNRYPGDMVAEAAAIIEERFGRNGISLDLIRGKVVLDAGCGSGRYSAALAKLGAAKVVAVDFGDDGLALAHKLAEGAGVTNIEFRKGDLRELPFDDASFDFVFSNGTAHHTGNIPACSREILRVLKPGGQSWFYIYGDGGVFWYSRRKMTEFMKSIPQDFALEVLRMIGMPMNRFLFADNWYVPIELHTSAAQFETLLAETGFTSIRRCHLGRATDPDTLSVCGTDKDREMWGDGELRYLVAR